MTICASNQSVVQLLGVGNDFWDHGLLRLKKNRSCVQPQKVLAFGLKWRSSEHGVIEKRCRKGNQKASHN